MDVHLSWSEKLFVGNSMKGSGGQVDKWWACDWRRLGGCQYKSLGRSGGQEGTQDQRDRDHDQDRDCDCPLSLKKITPGYYT